MDVGTIGRCSAKQAKSTVCSGRRSSTVVSYVSEEGLRKISLPRLIESPPTGQPPTFAAHVTGAQGEADSNTQVCWQSNEGGGVVKRPSVAELGRPSLAKSPSPWANQSRGRGDNQ